MTTATTMIPSPMAAETDGDGDQCVVLRDVGWKGYCTLLRMRGERSIPRMIYLDGSVYLMSPSFAHENLKERLGLFVTRLWSRTSTSHASSPGPPPFVDEPGEEVSRATSPSISPTRSGFEARRKLSLKVDPPPDLAIEAVVIPHRGRGGGSLP